MTLQTHATPTSLTDGVVAETLEQARKDAQERETCLVHDVRIRTPFPSPEDWRDVWIYFLLVDRFNNPVAAPAQADPALPYQGGTFEGIKQQLGYLKQLGVGAIWISPVLMNPRHFTDYYGGYAIQDFLRIEPRFCRGPEPVTPEEADEEFRDLVDAIHAEGMYVILDIVLNHVGDLFEYEGVGDRAIWKEDGEYVIRWRDGKGKALPTWKEIEKVTNLPRDAGVWPTEFQQNCFFRRRGDVEGRADKTQGDFGRLKELRTEYQDPQTGAYPVRDALIRAYQYLMAKFDLDGFRVDTLMYVERDFSRAFANAMREFALSIGKKNFLTFGEVWMDDDEDKIAEYVGRDTTRDNCGIVGFDAALDFPLRKRLEGVCKGVLPPKALADHMQWRLERQRTVVSSHGDIGAYFVTFLENHDMVYRYAAGCQADQVTLALTCLFTLQGIVSLYYGMEQGMNAAGETREAARECLWRAGVFDKDPQHKFYRTVAALTKLRNSQPALRYGRQYFRPLTGDGQHLGFSEYPGGVLAYSRILNDNELVIVANCSQTATVQVEVVVDRFLNPLGRQMKVLWSNRGTAAAVLPKAARMTAGCAVVKVELRPMEAQVLG